MHNMEIDFLAFRAPGAAHILGLILVRNGQIQTDQDGFVFPYLAVNDIVLIGAFIEISRGSYSSRSRNLFSFKY